jgi:hypothetical protein
VYRKTTAVKFMTTDKINGRCGYKGQEHVIDDQCGRPWINPNDQSEPRKKLQERHDDGNQVDEHSGEKVIPVNNLCKTAGAKILL